MKFLVLVIITTWSFGGGYQNTPIINMVSSPQKAAIQIWEDKLISQRTVEPDHKNYKLYEIDIEKKTIKEIEIPKLKFVSPASSDEK